MRACPAVERTGSERLSELRAHRPQMDECPLRLVSATRLTLTRHALPDDWSRVTLVVACGRAARTLFLLPGFIVAVAAVR